MKYGNSIRIGTFLKIMHRQRNSKNSIEFNRYVKQKHLVLIDIRYISKGLQILPRVVEHNPQSSWAYPQGSWAYSPGWYVRLPWGVCSTTLGSMFNYPGEYVQLPCGVCSTTLGSIFNYPGEYVRLPQGACSNTLGSMQNTHSSEWLANSKIGISELAAHARWPEVK